MFEAKRWVDNLWEGWWILHFENSTNTRDLPIGGKDHMSPAIVHEAKHQSKTNRIVQKDKQNFIWDLIGARGFILFEVGGGVSKFITREDTCGKIVWYWKQRGTVGERGKGLMVPLSCLLIFSEDLRAQLDSMKMAGWVLNVDRFRNKSSAILDSNPFPDLYLSADKIIFRTFRFPSYFSI